MPKNVHIDSCLLSDSVHALLIIDLTFLSALSGCTLSKNLLLCLFLQRSNNIDLLVLNSRNKWYIFEYDLIYKLDLAVSMHLHTLLWWYMATFQANLLSIQNILLFLSLNLHNNIYNQIQCICICCNHIYNFEFDIQIRIQHISTISLAKSTIFTQISSIFIIEFEYLHGFAYKLSIF